MGSMWRDEGPDGEVRVERWGVGGGWWKTSFELACMTTRLSAGTGVVWCGDEHQVRGTR